MPTISPDGCEEKCNDPVLLSVVKKHHGWITKVCQIRFAYKLLCGSISLCIDSFVFICVYFVSFRFILHSCCIIVTR